MMPSHCRRTCLGYGWVATLMTLLIPLSARLGFTALFLVRVLQGVGIVPPLLIIAVVSEEWSPVAYTGTYILVLSLVYQVGV